MNLLLACICVFGPLVVAGVPGSTAPGRAVSGVGEWGLMEGEPDDASTGGGGGSPTGATSSTFTQSVNPRNEIIDIVRTQTGGGSGSGGGSGGGGAGTGGGALTLPPQHDGVGNLIYDGRFIYHYDAWNRLVQVNKAVVEMVDAGQGTGDPEPDPQARLAAGPLVKQYVYDALGRLVETRTPIAAADEPPAPAGGPGANVIAPGPDGSATPLLAERFSYDGVRRIQETSEVRAAVNPPTPPEGSGGGGGSGSGGGTSWTGSTPPGEVVDGSRRFEREYIWGPGDGHAGVDELLALFEGARATEFAAAANSVPSGSGGTPEEQAEARLAAQQAVSLAAQSKPWWVIQDASGDVVALCDNGGPNVSTGLSSGAGPTSINTGRVVAQWTYDAYGNVLAAESLDDHPVLRVGHKGLFIDRFDAPLVYGADEPERLVPWAHTLYHIRHREYLPTWAVWLQQDPNATGLATQGMAFHGDAMRVGRSRPNLRTLYADGLNLHAYLGLNPLARSDPQGLESGYPPFRQVPSGGISRNRLVSGPNGGVQFWGDVMRGAVLRGIASNRTARAGAAPRPAAWAGGSIDTGRMVGRLGGILLGAKILDDRFVDNRAFWRSLNDAIPDVGGYAVGTLGPALTGNRVAQGALPWIGLAGSSGYNLASGGLDLFTVGAAVADTVAQFGHEWIGAAGSAVGRQATAVSLAASVYSGIIDYAAESVGDWWKR